MRIIFLLLLFSFLISANSCSSTNQISAPLTQEQMDKQQQRVELINELIDKGLFQKIEKPGKYPHVWVTPLFYALNFDNKQTFISVVYAYYYTEDKTANMVILNDSQTGKEIGKYATVYGGLKME